MNDIYMHLFRVSACSLDLKIADPQYNALKISEAIGYCVYNKVDLVVFPELCISGYTCADLFYQPSLHSKCLKALETIVRESIGKDIYITIGLPLLVMGKLYNCGCLILNGSILGIYPKTWIPNTNEFYEKRWFESWSRNESLTITLCGQSVLFSTELVVLDKPTGACIGVELCEDLLSIAPPSINYVENGANVICNLSASPQLAGKNSVRTKLVAQHSERLNCSYIYSSAGSFESNTDLLFSGHCIVAENGNILSQATTDLEQTHYVIADCDLDILRTARLKNSGYRPKPPALLTEHDRKLQKKMLIFYFE